MIMIAGMSFVIMDLELLELTWGWIFYTLANNKYSAGVIQPAMTLASGWVAAMVTTIRKPLALVSVGDFWLRVGGLNTGWVNKRKGY